MKTLHAGSRQRSRLQSLKQSHRYLGQTGKGLMIDDPEIVAIIGDLADRLGITKREVVRQSLAMIVENGDA